MSVLIIQVLSEGIIFGADRNFTAYKNGQTDQEMKGPKIFYWPDDKTIIGVVGNLQVDGLLFEKWLESKKEEFKGYNSLEELANKLSIEIEEQRIKDEGINPAVEMIVHIAGFEKNNQGIIIPRIWYIRNVDIGQFGYINAKKSFTCTEEFWRYFPSIESFEIRQVLKVRAKNFNPCWFHQSVDLITFNTLESAIRSSFDLLCKLHPKHSIPNKLDEWTKHVRMQVLMYGAYYEAFYPEGKRMVGGGADVLSLPWPEDIA
ncbi:MAG: hypothetical protein HPY53_06335 [Brevinematales bacterium]|nr:hypothetical protein [Brevinematales bacterium]